MFGGLLALIAVGFCLSIVLPNWFDGIAVVASEDGPRTVHGPFAWFWIAGSALLAISFFTFILYLLTRLDTLALAYHWMFLTSLACFCLSIVSEVLL